MHARKQQEETQGHLLKELCGPDDRLYAVLSHYMYETPLAAISEKELDVLIQEAEEGGKFTSALDKAIFEGAQEPRDRQRYIEVIQNLVSKSIHATEQEIGRLEKEGLAERAALLAKGIEDQRFISERAGDVLDVASRFYDEKLLQQEEDKSRMARKGERLRAEREEKRIGEQEEARRDARRKDRRKMGRREKREAKRRDRQEDLAAEGKKAAREEARKEAEREEGRIAESEKARRNARREERSGD
jgi:hypothetical protein